MKMSAAADSKNPKSKLRRLLWLVPLLLLLLCIIACHHVYSEYIAPRTGDLYFVTFEPFSGRLFLFDYPQRQVSVEYGHGCTAPTYTYVLPEDKAQEMVDFLDSFRYSRWLPGKNRGKTHFGEDLRRVHVHKTAQDGSAYKDAGLEIRIYKDRLEVGGVDYYCEVGWLQELWDMTERPGQSMPRGIPQ